MHRLAKTCPYQAKPGIASVLQAASSIIAPTKKSASSTRWPTHRLEVVCDARHNSLETWTNAQLLFAAATAASNTCPACRFGSRRAARAADDSAAAATIDANHAPPTIDDEIKGVRNDDGSQEAGRQVRDRPDVR